MEPTIYKPSIYKGAGIYKTGSEGGGGGGEKKLTILDSFVFVGPNFSTQINNAGKYKLLVFAINSEANTYSMDISVDIAGVTKQVNTIKYNQYDATPGDVRNYRIGLCEFEADYYDSIDVTISNYGAFSTFICVLLDYESDISLLKKSITKPDAEIGDSYDNNAIVFAIYCKGNSSLIWNLYSLYKKETLIRTRSLGSSYCSSCIFWFE